MTKKHFVAIAKIIKQAEPSSSSISYDDEILSFCRMSEDLATYFKEINPNFDHDRFLIACGAYELN